MNISEEYLKELVLRILKELESEKEQAREQENRQKLYMVCSEAWDERYVKFLQEMEQCSGYDVYPVIPASWQNQGYEAILRGCKSCSGITYYSCEIPEDLEGSVTVFPVTDRNVLVKAALCISDTYETSWIAGCMERGSRIVFLRSGLKRFSGKENPAYVKQIMSYYRQVLEYGIEICGTGELTGREPYEKPVQAVAAGSAAEQPVTPAERKKRVITTANVEQYAVNGVLHLHQGDIVTDMAKDRAKFLKIVIKR